MSTEASAPDSSNQIDFIVPAEADGFRADRAVARAFPDWSREQLKVCFTRGQVLQAGNIVAAKSKVKAGQNLQIILPERKCVRIEPAAIALSILFEDDDLVVVDKLSGMVTHPGSNTGPDTLVHALLHHTGGKLAAGGGERRPGVVHRLDKETSGAIVFAKTDIAYHALTRAFAAREVQKEYLAWVHGSPRLESGSLRGAIGRHPGNRVKMSVGDHGRAAHTDWMVEHRAGLAYTLLRCHLHTGRTHQIRVHLSTMGYPIIGDTTYGKSRCQWPPGISPRLLLHAEKLSFTHPVSNKPLHIVAPLPAAFAWPKG